MQRHSCQAAANGFARPYDVDRLSQRINELLAPEEAEPIEEHALWAEHAEAAG